MTPKEALNKLDETVLGKLEWKIALSKALKRQVPEKPTEIALDAYGIHYLCPRCCDRKISRFADEWLSGSKDNYCEKCGQALDWSYT